MEDSSSSYVTFELANKTVDSELTIDVDIPNKNGTVSRVPILLELPDGIRASELQNSKTSENDMLTTANMESCTTADWDNAMPGSLLDDMSLEDLADIVTTYKCKFCPFTCGWKTGLMSHIRSTHFDVRGNNYKCKFCLFTCDWKNGLVEHMKRTHANTAQPDSSDIPVVAASIPTISIVENQEAAVLLSGEDSNSLCVFQPNVTLNPPIEEYMSGNLTSATDSIQAQEKQFYLCGQCSHGFSSFELCKEHIKEHIIIQSEKEKAQTPQKYRRKAKPRKRNLSNALGIIKPKEGEVYIETHSKRKVRPPKALSEDYYLLSPRRKYMQRDRIIKNNFKCEFKNCNQHFISEENLSFHVRCHLPEGCSFQCPECSVALDNWRRMLMHLWREHELDLELLTCQDCSYRTHSQSVLENHRRIHSEDRAFACKLCDKRFKQRGQLRNHLVVHLDRKSMVEKRWFTEQKCEVCGRTYSDSKSMRKHMEAVHKKIKPYVCAICGHASARKAMWAVHLRQHTGEKPFECDLCEYRTSDHNSLRRHKMRHSGLRPYKCPHCEYACIQAVSFKSHLRSKHPGMEGIFCCDLCGFKSVSKENYDTHLAYHERGVIPASKERMTLPASNTETTLSDALPVIPVPDPSDAVETTAPVSYAGEQDIADVSKSVLPENTVTAQLIYSCLDALAQDGQTLPREVTAMSTQDGTITIKIPKGENCTEYEHIYLTIEQPQRETHASDETCIQTSSDLSNHCESSVVVDPNLASLNGGTDSLELPSQMAICPSVKGGLMEDTPLN